MPKNSRTRRRPDTASGILIASVKQGRIHYRQHSQNVSSASQSPVNAEAASSAPISSESASVSVIPRESATAPISDGDIGVVSTQDVILVKGVDAAYNVSSDDSIASPYAYSLQKNPDLYHEVIADQFLGPTSTHRLFIVRDPTAHAYIVAWIMGPRGLIDGCSCDPDSLGLLMLIPSALQVDLLATWPPQRPGTCIHSRGLLAALTSSNSIEDALYRLRPIMCSHVIPGAVTKSLSHFSDPRMIQTLSFTKKLHAAATSCKKIWIAYDQEENQFRLLALADDAKYRCLSCNRATASQCRHARRFHAQDVDGIVDAVTQMEGFNGSNFKNLMTAENFKFERLYKGALRSLFLI